MMQIWMQPETWISLATLAALEIVLGIDNIVFISILAGKLPREQQGKARKLGLVFALGTRLLLLLGISWVMQLTTPLFTALGHDISGRSLILLIGGLFLIGKSTFEIYESLEVEHDADEKSATASGLAGVVIQIMILDVVFSLDSVITAVGMVGELSVMVAAIVIAIGVMLLFADAVGNFVLRHPSMKMLALSFLILVGVLLTAEAFEKHLDRGYVYFAMAFSLGVELINMRLRKKKSPVKLHGPVASSREGR
jgi:predicted tellurium resistance membrane protein TerC